MIVGVRPGAEIDGFTVGERIHAGGMGDIFRVTKPGFERPLISSLPRSRQLGQPSPTR
jgi:eukaryotic-like serine/threonine-protein kinase